MEREDTERQTHRVPILDFVLLLLSFEIVGPGICLAYVMAVGASMEFEYRNSQNKLH